MRGVPRFRWFRGRRQLRLVREVYSKAAFLKAFNEDVAMLRVPTTNSRVGAAAAKTAFYAGLKERTDKACVVLHSMINLTTQQEQYFREALTKMNKEIAEMLLGIALVRRARRRGQPLTSVKDG